MPKSPSLKGPKRSRSRMADDVALALKSSLSRRAQVAVLNNVCWEWTEYDGKYEGCRWWTRDAIDAFNSKFDKPKRIRVKSLRHEHVVPRRVVIELLFGLPTQAPEAVLEVLQKFLQVVVVTEKQEAKLRDADSKDKLDNKMPQEFYEPGPSFHEPWLRYDRFIKEDPGFVRCPSTKENCHQALKLLKLQAKITKLRGK